MYKRLISTMLSLCMILSICVGVRAESTLPYNVGNIYFSDMTGNEISNPGNSCMVNAIVSKLSYRAENDPVIFAAYATDGTLIGFSLMEAPTAVGTDSKFATLMNFQGKTLGIVKAFVWDSILSMKALSNVAQIEVNEITEPITKPDKLIPDTLVVEGTVTETGKTGYSSLRANEVNFKICNVDFGFDYTSCTTVEEYQELKAREECIREYYFGDPIYYPTLILNTNNIDLSDYLNMYISIEISMDKNNHYSVERFVGAEKNNIQNLGASLFDVENTDITDIFDNSGKVIGRPFVRYYTAKDDTRSTKYQLNRDFRIYVNGVEVDTTETNFTKYVYNNTVGKVQLVDVYESGKGTDGYYDMIKVQYTDSARVDFATSKKIIFKDSTFGRSALTLDQEDNEDLVYHIYYNGEEIAITDLKEDDILSIAYDVNAGIANSNFYDIYVSRDIAEGKYTAKSDEDKTVKINGKNYQFAGDYNTQSSSMILGNEYKLYLDSFGRIYNFDILASSIKFAVADEVVTSPDYDSGFGVTLYFPDGTVNTYEVDANKTGMPLTALVSKVYMNGVIDNSQKVAIPDRVVEYKLDSTGTKIVMLKFQSISQSSIDVEYRSRTNSLAGIKMSSTAKIIDAREYNAKLTPTYSDLKIGSLDATFQNGVVYTAYAYGTKLSDGTYPFVIVTASGGDPTDPDQGEYPTDTTHFAVVSKTLTKEIDGSDEGYTATLIYDGESKDYFITDSAEITFSNGTNKIIDDSNYTDINKGDLIIFDKNTNGQIIKIHVVFNGANASLDNSTLLYRKIADRFIRAGSDGIALSSDKLPIGWYSGWNVYDSHDPAVIAGVIIDKKSNYFTLGQIKNKITNLDTRADDVKSNEINNIGGVADYAITDETKVSVIDLTESNARRQFYAGTTADIIPTTVSDAYISINSDEMEYIDWAKEYDGTSLYQLVEMNFAVAKIVDGYATDIFVIKGYID